MQYNSNVDRRFTLRLDDDLREVLTAAAQRQLRSLNAEIKFRLRQTLERQSDRRPPPAA
jgi:predicted HicB family RNase H-like nuclease